MSKILKLVEELPSFLIFAQISILLTHFSFHSSSLKDPRNNLKDCYLPLSATEVGMNTSSV